MSQGFPEDPRMIIWFDIDNTLYSASTKISQAMGQRIHAYFVSMGLDEDEASDLHFKYYTQYGLALRGLTRHHDIDPLDFDRKCDGTLPLEELIQPNPKLRMLIEDLDRTKVRVWALTNAYKNHANRVLTILGVRDQIEGVVFCDYENPNFTCKPEPEYYHNAMKQAGIFDPSKCLFIDDSKQNVVAAKKLGWGRCAHFYEAGLEAMEGGKLKTLGRNGDTAASANGVVVITDLEDLRKVWPDIFSK
ncbi:pyrimidine 5-nucleotidase [Pisolithus orientalis]|uniref:pyrimidine 5-nucleotidase n=1 Tax=Pisolithus orientalis TaxID=936130 RepID=UPI0022252783|nr:pyrimidine 5-nucleotidase [Pisolithus orientalis]KAI6035156.1 pyrimidine 5-nucleotidase [Pisolithus orientalis]